MELSMSPVLYHAKRSVQLLIFLFFSLTHAASVLVYGMSTRNNRTVADLGVVSEGTMRLEDLIPSFLDLLDTLRE